MLVTGVMSCDLNNVCFSIKDQLIKLHPTTYTVLMWDFDIARISRGCYIPSIKYHRWPSLQSSSLFG